MRVATVGLSCTAAPACGAALLGVPCLLVNGRMTSLSSSSVWVSIARVSCGLARDALVLRLAEAVLAPGAEP